VAELDDDSLRRRLLGGRAGARSRRVSFGGACRGDQRHCRYETGQGDSNRAHEAYLG
jgi:hypothetical protein